MIREEFAQFLKKLKTANENGQDIDAIVKENEYRNVYFYNDGCIKKILASEKNLALTTDLINAALNLVGSDRIENLHVISFQFFDAFKGSPNYLHTVQLRNQEQRVYFERQTVTLIEVNKFLKHAEQFKDDHSRIAQWLRAIDTLNREADFNEFATDSVFRVLQNEVKLCNFSSRYMLSNMMKDIDKSYWEYGAARKKAKEVAKNFLLDGDSVEKVARNTGLPQSTVLELQKEINLPNT